jgi:hypothetical protein
MIDLQGQLLPIVELVLALLQEFERLPIAWPLQLTSELGESQDVFD